MSTIWKLVTGFIISYVIAATQCVAQDNGRHVNLLKRSLQLVASGSCPEELMSPFMLATCDQQLVAMKGRLEQVGSIRNTRYRGLQQTPYGPAEVYTVNFANGTMVWMIKTGSDGKIDGLWSPG